MSLTVSMAEGVTVYTVQSNRNSKCPLICQILGTMCYSPVCSVSKSLKRQLGCALTALTTIQIMVGIINLAYGCLAPFIYEMYTLYGAPFWLGGMFITVGILCILAEHFPSQCLVVLCVMMNVVNAALSVSAIVLYSIHLAQKPWYTCRVPSRDNGGWYSWTTASPSKQAEWDAIYEKKLEDHRACQQNQLLWMIVIRSLEGLMIVLAVLQICVSLSWCVLSVKALRKETPDEEEVEDLELCKPLMDQDAPNPAR